MILALDAAYQDKAAAVGLVRFRHWTSDRPSSTRIFPCRTPDVYIPGAFSRRELPCLVHALEAAEPSYTHVLVDGYVHLREPQVKGLGLHLYEYLGGRVIVIGVAKNPLQTARDFAPILRGRSRRPLYVSAAGMDKLEAAELVAGMAGRHRIPAMLKLADSLARGGLPPASSLST